MRDYVEYFSQTAAGMEAFTVESQIGKEFRWIQVREMFCEAQDHCKPKKQTR
jgi:hypothetical protein